MIRYKKIFAFIILSICMSLTSCGEIQHKEAAIQLSSTFSKKQFCYYAHEYILAKNHIEHCYKHPISAFTSNKAWYWLSESRLSYHLLDVIGVEDNIIGGKGLAEADNMQQPVELDPTKPVVYLTFDDGPGKYTDRVLDILKEQNIRATFFVLGVQVERNPLFTKRIVDEGHTIGNHTFDHKYEQIYSNFEAFAEQVIETNKVVYELTGVHMTIFRAPGGSINNLDEGYFDALYAAGFTVFDWNIDSRDSAIKGIQSEDILKNITSSQLTHSAIVLLHDTTNHEQSMLALPDIIYYFKEAGYQFAPITNETKPMTFNLGKHLKWSREKVTEQQIEQFAKRIQQLAE